VEAYRAQGEQLSIAFVSDVMYPFHVGGAEKRIYEIGRRLAQAHDVHVFTMDWTDGEETTIEGVQLHPIAPQRPIYEDGTSRRSTRSSMLFARDCLTSIPTNTFDVLEFTQAPYLHFLSHRLFKPWDFTPTVFTVHDTWWPHWEDYLENPIQRQLARWVERSSYELADEILAVSQTTAAGMRAIGIDPGKINVAPNGVDYEQLARAEPLEDGYEIVYTGRLNSYKNVDMLVQAVKCLHVWGHEVRAGIVGEGPERERLEALVEDRGIDHAVDFLGYFPDIEDVYGLMKASSVLVQPSNVEGFGIVALEALSTGTPVLTLDSPTNATRELVLDDELGETFPPRATNLAAKLERWIYREEGHRERDVRRQFGRVLDWNRVAERVDRIYQRIREEGPAR
jgi:glycosyltransferase involved in cell wall biosynthesis